MIEYGTGIEARFDDFSLTLPQGTDLPRVRAAIRAMLDAPDAMQRLPISKRWLDELKFSDCLPESFAIASARGRIRVSENALATIRI